MKEYGNMHDKPFPFKTLLICLLIGLAMWVGIIKILAQQPFVIPQTGFSPKSGLTEKHWMGLTKHDIPRFTGWGLCLVGGIAWGAHEAYYADNKVFEKKFDANPYGWAGSRSWERKYPGNRYEKGEKPVWWKDKANVFREVKKTTAFIGRYAPITAGIVFTLNEKRKWSDYVAGVILYSGSATITYQLLRY